jgi:serine/threonine protein kinase
VIESSRSQPALPDYVGRYRVVDRIGKGAMGVVYGAMDEHLGRRVAVKLMLADFEEEPELRERFYREARITGQLAHRNIVTLFDLGEDKGRPFIVMELLDGVPLADYLGTAGASSLDVKMDTWRRNRPAARRWTAGPTCFQPAASVTSC